jgi:hypothetical protein
MLEMSEKNEVITYIAEAVQLTVRKHIAPELIMDVSQVKYIADRVVYDFRIYIAGMEKERIKIDRHWPSDWKEAFKERWFPHWLKRRFPVNYQSVHIDQPIYLAVCPHTGVDKRKRHLEWMEVKFDSVKPSRDR